MFLEDFFRQFEGMEENLLGKEMFDELRKKSKGISHEDLNAKKGYFFVREVIKPRNNDCDGFIVSKKPALLNPCPECQTNQPVILYFSLIQNSMYITFTICPCPPRKIAIEGNDWGSPFYELEIREES